MKTTAPPPVSVAFITYNHEAYVAGAITSILSQTFADFELVAVDDGSTDRTGEVIRAIDDERIVYVRQHNQGPSEARNTALRTARGAVIAQMSGDDIAEPERLERQLAAHTESQRRIVFSHCTTIDDRGETIDMPALDRYVNRPNWTREATLHHLFFIGNCLVAPAALASRSAFEEAGPYKATMLHAQDYDMWTRLFLKGYEPYVVQAPLLRYRVRTQSLSADSPDKRARAFFELERILREFLTVKSAEELARIFPELDTFGYPLDDDLVPFLLAMLALAPATRTRVLEQFGANVLLQIMECSTTRQLLADKVGFRTRDLFRILGEIEPPGERRHFTRSFRAYVKRVKDWSTA